MLLGQLNVVLGILGYGAMIGVDRGASWVNH